MLGIDPDQNPSSKIYNSCNNYNEAVPQILIIVSLPYQNDHLAMGLFELFESQSTKYLIFCGIILPKYLFLLNI